MANVTVVTDPARLTFDHEKHEYRLDGEVIPSTSGIIRDAGFVDYSGIDEDILRRKAKIGTVVHAATEIIDGPTPSLLDFDALHEKAKPYVSAYRDFRKRSDFEPHLMEMRMAVIYNGYKYGMTLDREGMLAKKKLILDIKTSVQVKRWVGVQTASYAIGATAYRAQEEGITINYERVALQLKKDGTFKIHNFTNVKDYQCFAWALALYHEKRRMLDGDKADEVLYASA